jgi:4-carboxymuconolactone decarboxylase
MRAAADGPQAANETPRKRPMPAKKTARKPAKKTTRKSSRKPAAKKLAYRLPEVNEDNLTPAQQTLLDSLRNSPRGKNVSLGGPFGVYMHAPEVGEVAQQFAAFCRYKTRLPKRLSEFAILMIGRIWKSQYEFFVHAKDGLAAGLKPEVIADLKAGRRPNKAAKDELALYDFIDELYAKRRVSDRNYKRAQEVLGDAGVIELLAICGSYSTTSTILNAFNVPLPEGVVPPFPEPKV